MAPFSGMIGLSRKSYEKAKALLVGQNDFQYKKHQQEPWTVKGVSQHHKISPNDICIVDLDQNTVKINL